MQMAGIAENSLRIQEVETHNIMTKSSLPVGGYSVNPLWGVRTAAGIATPPS